MKELIKKLKNFLIWNGIIEIITVGYLEYSTTWWITLNTINADQDEQIDASEYISDILIGIIIFIYPLIISYKLYKTDNKEL